MYINNVLYCFYSSDTEAFEACFRLLHDDDVVMLQRQPVSHGSLVFAAVYVLLHYSLDGSTNYLVRLVDIIVVFVS